MDKPISMAGARAIMGNNLLTFEENVLVPFTRAELFEARRASFSLFHIPEGSLRAFPKGMEHVHVDADIEDVRREEWIHKSSPSAFILSFAFPYPGTTGLPFWEQEKRVSMRDLFTPYEIVCMSALYKTAGKGKLFEGALRTNAVIQGAMSHLHTYPLTAILTFDEQENIRITRGYTSQVNPNLGVLAGTRRLAV